LTASNGKLPERLTVTVGLDDDDGPEAIRRAAARKIGVDEDELPELYLRTRSVDARRGRVRFNLQLDVGGDDPWADLGAPHPREVADERRVVVVGDGPAGLFAAYELARHGIGAIVLDRGKKVQPRRKDLKLLNQRHTVPPDSNYCFGEGGAGTYSDGKLYTRATKRGDVTDVMGLLALHGAPRAILEDARPHIGSNKLPLVVTALRERLEDCGQQFRFGAKVVGLLASGEGDARRVRGVRLEGGEEIAADEVVLATGHSARDVWEMLRDVGVQLEAKPFALGVRIEHPQPLINQIQYGAAAGHPKLPNAPYRLAHTEGGRGVFSFCMCPGGFVVPASTESGALVVNGMSLSRRDSPFANSGLVVSVELEDVFPLFGEHPFAGVELQKKLEELAWQAGGGGLRAPAARATDLLAGRAASTLPDTSYQPGVVPTDIRDVLDGTGLRISHRIRDALSVFDEKMRGYLTEDAILIGVESRTSAPVRVPRDDDSLESPDLAGLYPAGEGAGYAGGIVSAALDGINVARQIAARR
jgi:uncharacterized FAD-dependent dehydrogenase